MRGLHEEAETLVVQALLDSLSLPYLDTKVATLGVITNMLIAMGAGEGKRAKEMADVSLGAALLGPHLFSGSLADGGGGSQKRPGRRAQGRMNMPPGSFGSSSVSGLQLDVGAEGTAEVAEEVVEPVGTGSVRGAFLLRLGCAVNLRAVGKGGGGKGGGLLKELMVDGATPQVQHMAGWIMSQIYVARAAASALDK